MPLLSDQDVFGAQQAQPKLLSDNDVFGQSQQVDQKLQQPVNAWGEPVKQVDLSPGNIRDAAIGAFKDAAMMIPNQIASLGALDRGMITPTREGDENKAAIPLLNPPTKKLEASDVPNLALPFLAVPKDANIVRPMTPEQASTMPDIPQSVANFRSNVAANKAPYDPMNTMKAISNSFNDAIDKANTFYGFPQQLAEGRSVAAPQVANHLDSVIQDVNDSPWHEAKSQVGTLQRIRDSLPDDGTVPVNDLLDLRKFTNKFFNPARMTDKSATYGQLNSAVDSGLNAAKETIPNFEDALDIADNYWRNNVTSPFLKNKVLQKAWSPEDAHNLRMVDEGYLDEPGDLTQQRAQNLVQTVKDVPSYNAIRRTLPDDVGQKFDTAVLQNMPAGRIQAAGKAVANTLTGHWPSALRNVADIINPDLSDAEKATIQAVKKQNTYTPLSTKNDVAQAAYENLMQANMRGEGHPLSLPKPPIYGSAPQAQTPAPQLALRGPGYDPLSPENIGKLPSPSSVSGPRMNEPVTRNYTPTPQEMWSEKEALSPKQLPKPSSSIQVPAGGFKRTYSPSDLNAGDEGQAISTLEGIARGQKTGGRIARASGGAIPSKIEWAQMLFKARKKGVHLLAKDRENPAQVEKLKRSLA